MKLTKTQLKTITEAMTCVMLELDTDEAFKLKCHNIRNIIDKELKGKVRK